MKVVVTSQAHEMSSQVASSFDRSEHFVIVDTGTGKRVARGEFAKRSPGREADVLAASSVVQLGVPAVITGNVGEEALSRLQAEGIDVYVDVTGSVKDAVDQFLDGRLECPRAQELVTQGIGG